MAFDTGLIRFVNGAWNVGDISPILAGGVGSCDYERTTGSYTITINTPLGQAGYVKQPQLLTKFRVYATWGAYWSADFGLNGTKRLHPSLSSEDDPVGTYEGTFGGCTQTFLQTGGGAYPGITDNMFRELQDGAVSLVFSIRPYCWAGGCSGAPYARPTFAYWEMEGPDEALVSPVKFPHTMF